MAVFAFLLSWLLLIILPIAGWLSIASTAFRNDEPAWFLLCVLVPPVAIAYAILNFDDCWRSLLCFLPVSLLWLILYTIGVLLEQ